MSFPGLTLRTVSPLRRVGSKAKKKSPMIGGFFALVAGGSATSFTLLLHAAA
jgi:hypothetical protein